MRCQQTGDRAGRNALTAILRSRTLKLAVWPALVLAGAGVGMGCSVQTVSSRKGVVRLLAGPVGGGFTSLTAELVHQFALTVPNIEFTLVERKSSETTVDQLERDEADLAMTLADPLDLRSRRESSGRIESVDQIRAVAALDLAVLQFVVPAGSDIRRLEDLARPGKRVARTRTLDLMLASVGIHVESPQAELAVSMVSTTKMMAGEVDAGLYTLGYPADAIAAAIKGGGHLLPVEGPAVERLLRRYSFLQLTVIPAGAYRDVTQAVRTIGIPTTLLCRRDLDEDLVYQLTRQLFEVLPRAAALTGGFYVDLAHSSATPIRLHEGAARYYRERQLFG